MCDYLSMLGLKVNHISKGVPVIILINNIAIGAIALSHLVFANKSFFIFANDSYALLQIIFRYRVPSSPITLRLRQSDGRLSQGLVNMNGLHRSVNWLYEDCWLKLFARIGQPDRSLF